MPLKYFSQSFLQSRLSLLKKIAYSDIQFHFKITYCTLYSNNLSLPCICIAYLGPTLNCKSLQLYLGAVSLEAVSCVLCVSSPVSWTVFAPICLCATQGCLYQIFSSLLNCTKSPISYNSALHRFPLGTSIPCSTSMNPRRMLSTQKGLFIFRAVFGQFS